MTIATLIEMDGICRMRATFTQENVDQMMMYDPELARKAQIALQHDLAINFIDLEVIELHLPRLLKEKEELAAARQEIRSRQPGDYSPMKTKCENFRPECHYYRMTDTYRRMVTRQKEVWKVKNVPDAYEEETGAQLDWEDLTPAQKRELGGGDQPHQPQIASHSELEQAGSKAKKPAHRDSIAPDKIGKGGKKTNPES